MDRKTFKEMPFLKKVQWILQYYGLTIVVVITVLFVGGLFLKTVFGPGDGYELRVMILDDYCSKEAAAQFAKDLDEQTGVPCEVVTYMQADPTQLQSFAVRLFSDAIDVAIAPEYQMTQLVKNGYFAEAQMLSEHAYYYQGTGYDAQERDALFIGYCGERAMKEHVPEIISYFTAEMLQ